MVSHREIYKIGNTFNNAKINELLQFLFGNTHDVHAITFTKMNHTSNQFCGTVRIQTDNKFCILRRFNSKWSSTMWTDFRDIMTFTNEIPIICILDIGILICFYARNDHIRFVNGDSVSDFDVFLFYNGKI